MLDQLSEVEASQGAEKQAKRKKDKVRSAWISFAGRIVAQVVGAMATVALGVMVLHSYGASGDRPRSLGDASPSPQSAPVGPPRPDGETSLAVLPFENLSADLQNEYFADGMTEALIADLSKVDGPPVISRTSSMYFKGQRKPLREIAQQLGVRWIVEGSIALAGKRVRITAQLIDADTDRHLWADRYDGPVTDVLAVQAEVAGAISRAVTAELLQR